MVPRGPIPLAITASLAIIGGVAAAEVSVATVSQIQAPEDARQAMEQAARREEIARRRAEQLAAEARQLGNAAERSAREAAALAAQIQQAEAAITARAARRALIGQRRAVLETQLEARRAPLARLVAALQMLSRRPPALALFSTGAIEDAVHLSAVLAGTRPAIAQRTAELRRELAAVEALEQDGRAAMTALAAARTTLDHRRADLARLAARQQVAAAATRSEASREEDRALVLAEESRDLDALTAALESSARLRAELAALPGPRLREVAGERRNTAPSSARPGAAEIPRFILPADGRMISSFGQGRKGVSLATAAGAQIVAPAAGRVAFAGPYDGYDAVVIIEHDGGWVSVVTGLRQSGAAVGARVVRGSPIGRAGRLINYELRQNGVTRDPLAMAADSGP